MSHPDIREENNFEQALFASYANIAIMELKLYNNSQETNRPTHKEILYMYSIWANKGCTASDLVDLFDSSKALVSQTVIGMEKKGYIYREKDSKDNRRQILKLSEERFPGSIEEMRVIDAAVKNLRNTYSQEDIVRAAKILQCFTDNMMDIVLDETSSSK